MHAFITLAGVYLLVRWLVFETKNQTNIWLHWRWVAIALVLQVIAIIFSFFMEGKTGNLILHGLGGGVVSCLLFFYLIRTFNIQLNWRLELAALFMFVSSLGVINELLEYVGQLTTPWIFNADLHDTWRDLTANSTGAVVAWFAVRIFLAEPKTGEKQR